MSEPNTSLRAVRQSMRLSQDELARAVREAGQRAGEPNGGNKRLVQRWEAGSVTTARGIYVRALEYVTGQPVENLGFKPADERYGMDRGQAMDVGGGSWIPLEDPKAKGPLTGIWLSRYEYESSSRGGTYSDEHYVVIIQHGARLQVRSVPAAASRLMMDLTANGAVITGPGPDQARAPGAGGSGPGPGCRCPRCPRRRPGS